MITADQLVAHAIGDYLLQSDWMANKKRTENFAAFAHALTYSLPFLLLLPWPSGWVLCGFAGEPPPAWWCPGGQCGFHCSPWPRLAAMWLVIVGTHFLIDRFGLARHVVWAKNFLAPRWIGIETVAAAATAYYTNGGRPTPSMQDRRKTLPVRNLPFEWCAATGYPPERPPFLAVWLLIIADNILHVVINGLALRYL